jgi:hypothetical protein
MRMGQDCKGEQNNGAEIGRRRFALIFDWEIGLGPSPLQISLVFPSPNTNKIHTLRLRLLPRVLRNVSSIDMSTTILGEKIEVPFCIAPTACHVFSDPEGELATARGECRLTKVIYCTTNTCMQQPLTLLPDNATICSKHEVFEVLFSSYFLEKA